MWHRVHTLGFTKYVLQAPPRRLPLEERLSLALSVGEECVQVEELRMLLEKKPNPVAYDGFEPSGRMHIAQVRDLFTLCRQ